MNFKINYIPDEYLILNSQNLIDDLEDKSLKEYMIID